MEMRRLGRTDIEVSSLCLGTMMFGSQLDRDASFHQMDRSLDAGINFFDTAEIYSVPPKPEWQGESERIVGEWLRARGAYGRVIITTKVCGRSKGFQYLRRSGERPVLDEANIREAVEASLQRLGVDVIDYYQVHWPDRDIQLFGDDITGYQHYQPDHVPIEETLIALTRLIDEGKLRAIGVSNETSWGVMRYLALSEANGLARIHGNQNAYNLLNRTYETGLAEIALQEQVGLLSYSPLGQGYLSGKYLDGAVPTGSRLDLYGPRMPRYVTPAADDAIRAYLAVARDFGIDPTAMALRFVETRPWTTSAIFGASNDAQLDTVLTAADVTWTEELETAVNAVHARYTNPCP